MIMTVHGQSRRLPVFSAVITVAIAVLSEPTSIGQKFCNIESMSAA